MALLADLDPASVPNTPSQLEPADTLSVDHLDRVAAAPTPQPLSLDALDRLGAGDFPVHIDQPAPATRGGLDAVRQKLRFESDYQPAQTLTPEGTNPQIVYPRMEDTSGNPVTDTLAQGGLGILQAGAQIGRKFEGLSALTDSNTVTHQQRLDQAAEFANVSRGLEAVGKSIGGVPGVRQVISMVVGSAPELALGGPAGLAGIATTFGASAAGNAYADAKEQGYEHPEAYALISGLLAAGTSLIPGYRGRNLVAKAMDEIGSPSWKQYLAQTVGQYMGKGVLATHGVSNALMMGVQTTLQGLLDQQTINPDLQWKDIVENAALSAGMGGLIGEGFGALGQAAHLSTRKAQVGAILKEYIDGVNNSIMAGNPRQAGHELRTGIVPATESVPAPATHEEEPSASVAARNNPAPAQSDLPAGWARPQPTQSDMDYGAGGEMPNYENPMGSSLRKTPEPVVPGVPPKPPEVVKGALKPASPAIAAQPEISPAFKAASESVNTAKHQGELDSAMKAVQKNKKLSTDEALELGAAAADLRRSLPPDPASLPKIQKPEPAKQVASDWLEKLRAKKEAAKEAKVQKAKSTKLEPALTPEVAQVYKDKLLVNMGGRHMDITAGSYAEGDSHLRLVLGKDAPSWSKLEAANVVSSEKLPNGQVQVKVKQVEVEVAPAIVPTAESRVKAGVKPEHVRITVSPEQEGIPGSGYVQVDEVHPKLGNTFSSNAEALNALGFKMPSTAELKTLPKGQYTLPEAIAKLREGRLPITKVVTKGSLRVKGLEGLPKKGERIPVGDFYITRNRLGKVVLMTEGVDRALATLKKESPEALTQKAIMEDLVARESGNRTKFWEVPEVKRGALAKAGKEVRKESAQADPEQFQKDVMGAMPKGPEGDALVEAMLRGAVDPVMVRKLVGELVAEKGAKVTGEELVGTLKQGVKQYLAGKLKERTEAGQAGHTPAEITSGMDAKAIKALYPDEKALAGRVLGILVGNRQVDLEVQNKYAAGAVAPVVEEEGTGFRGPVEVRDPDASAPVGKGGHTHEDVVTQFEDSDLDTPTKEKAAELANDIKQEVLSGDTKRYDQGLEILTKTFGFSPGKAAEWMDSETLFMAPHRRMALRPAIARRSEIWAELSDSGRVLNGDVTAPYDPETPEVRDMVAKPGASEKTKRLVQEFNDLRPAHLDEASGTIKHTYQPPPGYLDYLREFHKKNDSDYYVNEIREAVSGDKKLRDLLWEVYKGSITNPKDVDYADELRELIAMYRTDDPATPAGVMVYVIKNHPELLDIEEHMSLSSEEQAKLFAKSKLLQEHPQDFDIHRADDVLKDWGNGRQEVEAVDPALRYFLDKHAFKDYEFQHPDESFGPVANAPGKSGARTLPNGKPDSGKLRPATREDFGKDEDGSFGLWEESGLLSDNPIRALEALAEVSGPEKVLPQFLLDHYKAELRLIKLATAGGAVSGANGYYLPDSSTIKVSLAQIYQGYKSAGDRWGKALEVVMHEAMHGLTLRKLEMLGPDSAEFKELVKLMEAAKESLPAEARKMVDEWQEAYSKGHKEFDKVVDRWETEHPDLTNNWFDVAYGLSDVHEFMAQSYEKEDMQAYLATVPATKNNVSLGSLWQAVKNWIAKLLTNSKAARVGDKSIYPEVVNAIQKVMDRPMVATPEWLEHGSGIGAIEGSTPKNYPEIRNPRQLREYTEFQDLPKDEQETLTRYAGAGNVWLKSPDVQSVLSAVPKEALGLLKATIGNRLDVLQALEGRPGQAQTLQEIMADPHVPMEIKQSTSLGVLHNLLWFRRSGELLRSKFENKFLALVEGREKLDKGINEQTARVQALEGAIDRLTSEFKSSVMVDKRTAVDAESMEQLNRLIALADELKGDRRSALSRVITSMAENLDLETLITVKDPAELSRLYDEHFPATPETAQLIGASEETIKLAAILLSRASTARDELLSLKLLRDEELQKGVFALNKQVNEDLRTKNIDKIIDQFSAKVDRLATRKERERAIWKQLYANKLKQIREVKKAHLATQAMGDILKTGTFRDLEQLVVNNHKLQQPMKYLLDTGVIQYTHPLDRTAVDIGDSYNAATERENLQKLSNIIEAARLYVSNPAGPHYTAAEAAFWKEEIAKSAFLLDPSISYGARKLVGAAYDPYKLSNFLGQYLMIPEFELRRVGGRAAIDVINGLQALSAVDSQASNLKRSWDAAITLSADKAAKAHKMPIEQWHNEVLNPLIASRQTIGWTSLRPGSKTIYGHTILAEDEAAFKAQRDMDRRLVEIATTGQGNTAVAANASRVSFKAPGGTPMTRAVSHTGPDTMSRRIDPATRGLAFQWSQDANVAKRIQFLNDNFERVVLGHLVTSGAPDYSIGSKYQELYRAVMKTHGDNPVTNVDDLLTRLFDAQDGRIAPEYQASKDELLRSLIEELDQAFKGVAGFHEGTPKPDVGALLRVVDTDNSFTAARGRLIAPSTFYNYGLTFEGQRLGRIHSAKAYYTLELSGKNGRIDRLLKVVDGQRQAYLTELEGLKKEGKPIKEAQATLAKRTEAEQKRGELLLTYEQTNFAWRRLNLLKEEFTRLLSSTGVVNDPDARQLVTTAQSFVAANVLGGVQSQNNNAFGGLTNLMLIDKMVLGRSATLSAAQLAMRVLLTKGPAEIAANLTKFVDPSNKWALATLRNPATRVITGWMADVIDARMDLHKEMEKYGLSPTANVRQDVKALLTMPSGRPQLAPTSRLQSGVRRLESVLGTFSTPLSAFAPRLVDRFINELTVWKANDIEDMLRKNAWRYGQAREQAGMREPFQPSEWFGKKVSDKQAELFRALFTRTSMSLDNLMWRYYDAMKGASETARKTMPLFTPEESASFQYSLAQDVNLATFANRPTSTKGGRGRNLIGLFWGFPSWQASRLSDYLARASTDKSTAAHIPTIMMATMALAAMGAASVKVTKELKDWIYGEKSAYPDLTEAKNPGDAIQALSFGLFTYIPFLGNLVNNLTSDQSMRGLMDVNTKFVMLNFANDAVLLVKNIVQSHDLEHPLEDFLRRWSPLARIVVNRLPDQTGLTEYYNLAREARSLAPDSIPRRKRGAGQYDATPVTPMLQNMVNAAYNGDGTAFQKAANEYVQYKVGEGLSPQAAQESLRSAWRSRHPFVSQFGRMPTEAESAVIYQNADTDQRAAIDKANSIFETYGKVLGTNVALTSKGNTEPVVLSGGSGGGGSGGAKGVTAMGSLLARGGIAGSLLGSPTATGLAGSPALGGSLLTASGGGGANVSAPAGKAFQGPAKASKGRGSLRLKTGHAGALRGKRVGPTLKTSKVGNGKAIKMKKGSLRLRRPV